jgi:hypothetical protein
LPQCFLEWYGKKNYGENKGGEKDMAMEEIVKDPVSICDFETVLTKVQKIIPPTGIERNEKWFC